MSHLSIVNYGAVLLFGIVLSLAFSDISIKDNKKLYVLVFCSFGITQAAAYFIFGYDFLYKSYPLLTHLPLFLMLKFYCKKNTYISAIAVLSAYLFCTPRKWLGTLVSLFWNYDTEVSYIVQIIVTIPLLLIIVKYVSPYVSRLKYESDRILKFFVAVPLIYYVLEYFLTVYTDLLYQGGNTIAEFMDAAVVVIYFIFSIVYLKTLYEKKEVEVEQALLKILADQSISEIEVLRESEKQASIYRHDLRHHMNYLNSCISENNSQDALLYITSVCKELDNAKVTRYCGNETVNLILSSYSAKASDREIRFDIDITTADFDKLSAPDLCCLLSNAIENSMHACEKIADTDKRCIKLRMYSKNNKLCIDIRNSYQAEPVFKQGLPISNRQEHGFGTKSMVYIMEKYNGIYQFSTDDGWFIFQAIV
jgi:hypothetical protein